MTDDTLGNKVMQVIEDTLHIQVSLDDDMTTVREWDSMAQFSILVNIEKAFDFKFTLEEIANASSVIDWISITNSKISKSADL